jgi:hypothetical protein
VKAKKEKRVVINLTILINTNKKREHSRREKKDK